LLNKASDARAAPTTSTSSETMAPQTVSSADSAERASSAEGAASSAAVSEPAVAAAADSIPDVGSTAQESSFLSRVTESMDEPAAESPTQTVAEKMAEVYECVLRTRTQL
jgi:hypothetical protein